MKTMTKAKTRTRTQPIIDDVIYTLVDMERGNFFPWCGSIRKYRELVQADMANDNYMRATIIGSGRQRRYYITGKNIKRFLQAVDNGYRNILQV